MWSRLDDGFFEHPKVIAAGRDPRDLYLVALTYAARYLTDGLIPAGVIESLALTAGAADAWDAAARLVAVELWEEVPGGYLIHDWHDYNESGAAVRERRRKNAERQAAFRARGHDAQRNAVRNGVTNADPVPVPVPVPDPLLTGRHAERGELQIVDNPRRATIAHRSLEARWRAAMGEAVTRPLTPIQLREADALEVLAIERGRGDLVGQAIEYTARKGLDRGHWLYFVNTLKGWLAGDGGPEAPRSQGEAARSLVPAPMRADLERKAAAWEARQREAEAGA